MSGGAIYIGLYIYRCIYIYKKKLRVLPNTKVLAIQIPEISSELVSKPEQEGQKYFPWNLIYFQYTLVRNITLKPFKSNLFKLINN